MEVKFDVVTMAGAFCVAVYVAIAIGYVARYDLGFSLEEIGSTAVLFAVLIATVMAIDFYGKKLGKAK